MAESELIEEVYLEPELEKELQDRLSRIAGHVNGVKRMLTEHRECEDILLQVVAVKAAVNQVAIKLLEGHMETCVSECVLKGEGVQALKKLRSALSKVLK